SGWVLQRTPRGPADRRGTPRRPDRIPTRDGTDAGFGDIGSGLFSGKLGRIDTMPQPYPKEFRDDVVCVALNRDEKTTIGQIAKDFGVHEGTIAKWLRQADIDAGNKPGTTTDESAELRELRRLARLLEQ